MPLLNYTTKVNAQKTVTEVMGLLVAKGADEVSIVYDNNQQLAGLKWTVQSPRQGRAKPTLPCNIDCGIRQAHRAEGDGDGAGVPPPAGNTDLLADSQGLGGGPDGPP